MPKRRDPTLMEKLQREDIRESQLKKQVGKNLSPQQGLKRGLKPSAKGPEDKVRRRGFPY